MPLEAAIPYPAVDLAAKQAANLRVELATEPAGRVAPPMLWNLTPLFPRRLILPGVGPDARKGVVNAAPFTLAVHEIQRAGRNKTRPASYDPL